MRNKDSWIGASVGAVCFIIYWLTLYPGVVGTADTPRLQLVGPVLGTAHTPGYPVYTLISHVFSLIPLGSYAYRANLMSACFASLAVVLVFALARRLGARSAAAAVGALAMGFGPVFWSQALLAEVYSLGAAVIAGMALALLFWATTGRLAFMVAAATCFALGLGHRHVDVITAVPALLLFLYLYRRERPLSRRDALLCAGIAASGILSYAYVVARTLQGAPYLATRASTLAELVLVWRGGSFASQLFAFAPGELLAQRLPLVAGLLVSELSFAGIGLAALGSWALYRRRPREVGLLLLTIAGNVFFVLNYAAADIAVFLIPSFVALWPLAAVGITELTQRAGQHGRRWSAVAITAMALLPVWQLATHYRTNDHHARSLETRFLGALFETLPKRTAIVRENDIVDSMLLYKLLAEGAAGDRDIILIPGDQESVEATTARGYEIFAFPQSVRRLAAVGFGFVPVTLLDESLPDHLARLRERSPTLIAGGGSASGVLEVLNAIGVRPKSGGDAVVAIGLLGGQGVAELGSEVELELPAHIPRAELDWVPPSPIRLTSREGAAVVRIGGENVLRTEDGIAAVVLAPGGRVTARLEADAREGLRVPFAVRPLALRRLAFPRACSTIGAGWGDVTDRVATGRIQLRGRDAGTVTLYLGHERPLNPRKPGGSVEELELLRSTRPEFAAALAADGVAASQLSAARHAIRISIILGAEPISLNLGGVPAVSLARAGPAGQVCALPTAGVSYFEGDRLIEKLDLTARGTPFLGDGWGVPREDGPFFVREVEGRRGELLIPSAAALPVRIRLEARLEDGPEMARLDLVVGHHAVGDHAVTSGWRIYEWTLPAGEWRRGTNVLSLGSSAGRLFVRRLHFIRE